jgi:hypothetical protein
MLTLSRDGVIASAGALFTPHVTPVAPALGRAFDADCRQHDTQTAVALRDATTALVERLKRDELPPERVVVALKTAILKYGSLHRMPSLVDDGEDLCWTHCVETYRQAFAWCLDAYFGTAAPR